MANVEHNTLTGAALHEPKGIGAASSGTVYVADGLGSGAWSSATATLGITGMIADFITAAPPTGWLECDGTSVSRATFPALFSAVTIQSNGTRTASSAIITGLANTGNFRIGYTVGGTGIPLGTTILTVDSGTQITMSANASSSGTATVIVSPWAQGDGTTTFTLPDTVTFGRYRRSRLNNNVSRVGVSQTDSVTSHTHAVSITGTASGTTNTENAVHDHNFSGGGTTSGQSADHTHVVNQPAGGTTTSGGGNPPGGNLSAVASGTTSNDHTHSYSFAGTTLTENAFHAHTFAGTVSGSGTASAQAGGGLETRPISLIVLTCVKT